MHRKQLLAAMATASALVFSGFKKPEAPGKGFVTRKGDGRYHGHLKLKGVNENILDVKVSGKDTDGALAILEQTSLSQGRGTPLHVHPAQDEVFYILEGAYRFKVGGDVYDLVAGDSIFLPRQVPHAWMQQSRSGKMTVLVQPAGKLEAFFVALAAMTYVPTAEEVKTLFAAHEMEVVGPPLAAD